MNGKRRAKGIRQPMKTGVAKVPVVMQLETVECGAASLAMVLAYFGKWLPLEQVRGDCGVSRDGANLKNMMKAANGYGLRGKAFRFEPEDLKTRGTFPCIIHWNFNHFVVLNGFKGGKAYINDPAKGSCVVSAEEFDESFTGICMTFEPGEAFQPGGQPKSMLRYALKRLRGAGSAVVFTALTTALASLIAIWDPAFSRIFLDRILTGRNPSWLLPFLLAFGGFTFLRIAAAWIQAVSALRVTGKLAVVGSSSFLWQVLRMPMAFFSQRMAGDIQQRQQANGKIAETLLETLAPLAIHTALMLFYLLIMLRYSPVLTFIGVFSILLRLLLGDILSRRRVNITRVRLRDAGKLAGETASGIDMIETIKSSGAENGFFEKWAGYQASVNTQEVRCARLEQRLGLLPLLVSRIADVLVLASSAYLTMRGEFTIGMLMAFQGFLSAFSEPAGTLVKAGQTLQELRTEMERVEDVMEYPTDLPEEIHEESGEYDKLSGALELRHVTFGYSRLEKPLIEDFSLTLSQGSRVAFVGASGCGKSTLSKLISGLYEPWSGEILFDGSPIRKIDRNVFTGSLAVVDQDIILFEDTIADNIKMWDSSIENFEMIMAARDAQIHEDIMQRNGGYQYRMMEGGRDFSGGQRQRMEIARVLAQDPTIIILDEATSALDARTEYEVVKSIKDRGITCIVVAHRLSTIRDCDEIIVLEHGKVAERGTHEELYAKGGYYTRLVSSE